MICLPKMNYGKRVFARLRLTQSRSSLLISQLHKFKAVIDVRRDTNIT